MQWTRINTFWKQKLFRSLGNHFSLQDCEDPNPLIRALAVRTMGCIRVDKITEYLCEPLRKCLKDEDPYVRKTAAVCVAKLHDINAQMVEDQGFLDSLRDLIADSNPMVGFTSFSPDLEQISSVLESSIFNLFQRFVHMRDNGCLTGCCQCSRCSVWNQWVASQQQPPGPESTEHQQAAHGPQWVHRVGADLHPGLPVQLQPQGRQRGPKVLIELLIDSHNGDWLFSRPFWFSLTLSFSSSLFPLAASVSASLPGCPTPTQPWCCLLLKCWWSFWNCCPKTRTTTTPCWKSCPHRWSPYCQESLRSSMWLWGTSTSSSRKGVYLFVLYSDLTTFQHYFIHK